MLYPHFLLWIVLVLVTFLTPSSATQTTFKAGDAGLQFSAGWANRTLNDIPFVLLAGEGDISIRLLGMTNHLLANPDTYVCFPGYTSWCNSNSVHGVQAAGTLVVSRLP